MAVDRKILSIDLGGSSAKVALINSKGKIEFFFENIKTRKPNILENLWTEIEEQNPNLHYDAIGLAIPGMIDHEKGIVVVAGNLGWKNYDLNSNIKSFSKKPCFILNDANAVGLGECWVGAGNKYKSLLFYTIGTGIGGALILNNKLITGYKGTAGEFGHGGNFQNKTPCTCGLKNCLEPLACARNLKKELLKLNVPIQLRAITNSTLLHNMEVWKVFSKCWESLTDHMSIMIYALNPEVIIIGGGVSNIGDEVCNIIYSLIRKKVDPLILGDFKVLNATLGNKAGMYGAAKYALDSLKLF